MSRGVGVWAELMSDDEVASALPELGELGLRLGLALPSERVGDESFARLTRRAAELGVPVRAWPLLPRELGYWFGEQNAQIAAEIVGDIARWRRAPGGPALAGVSFDLEPAFEYSEALRSAGSSRPDRLLELLLAHVDPIRFDKARDTFSRAVDLLHDEGLESHAVTYPLVLDQLDGGTVLEDALDVPISGIAWDEVSVMVYQTPIAELTGNWLGPDLIHSYAADAVKRFGSRAGLDLGIVGDHGVGVGAGNRYPSPRELGADLGAALAAGIPLRNVRIYGLRGLVDSGGVRRWLGSLHPLPLRPEPSALVSGLRNGVRALGTALRVARGR